jgi:hypothetical protein
MTPSRAPPAAIASGAQARASASIISGQAPRSVSGLIAGVGRHAAVIQPQRVTDGDTVVCEIAAATATTAAAIATNAAAAAQSGYLGMRYVQCVALTRGHVGWRFPFQCGAVLPPCASPCVFV